MPPDSAGADPSPREVPEAAVLFPEPRTFLTAEWRHLLMLNYSADPRILRPHVPRGTELDDWDGTTYLSVVGFMFLKTRVLGLPIPWHRSFTEVNLRFYVRRRAAEGWRRGVVFLKEIVPRRAIAAIARLCYNEPYVSLPMSHHAEAHEGTLVPGSVLKYSWQHEARWCSVAGRVAGAPKELSAESEARFITEHYWGYSTRRDGGTTEYRVTHAPWRVTDAIEPQLVGDVASLYGVEYADALAGPPRSAFVASGSPVRVGAGSRICMAAGSTSAERIRMRRLCWSLAIAVSLSSASCARAINDTAPVATQDVTSMLRTADNRNWYLQIVGDSSTAQGTITSLTAEQVRVGGQRIEVADIDMIR